MKMGFFGNKGYIAKEPEKEITGSFFVVSLEKEIKPAILIVRLPPRWTRLTKQGHEKLNHYHGGREHVY